MCKVINEDAGRATKAVAVFRKGNEPEDVVQTFDVIARPCLCGAKMFVRMVRGGWPKVWQEAEPVGRAGQSVKKIFEEQGWSLA